MAKGKNNKKSKAPPAKSSGGKKGSSAATSGSSAAAKTKSATPSNGFPMNISSSKVSGECKLKCEYLFNYQASNTSTATNYGTNIQITYGDGADVTFNNNKYKVTSINIYTPSLHYYNDSTTAGELCIKHSPIAGGKNLMVYIPLSTSGVTLESSQIITNIINSVSKFAPAAGNTTNQGIYEFTLNNVVPMKPFYTYSTTNIDVIIFGLSNAIGISQDTLNTLKKIVKSSIINPAIINTSLFVNNTGPVLNVSSDIMMDCQPTYVEESANIIRSKSVKFDLSNNQNFMYLLLLFGIMLFIYMMYVFSKFISTSNTPSSNSFASKIQ